MDALIGEFLKQGTLGLMCIILLVWLGTVMKDRDDQRKENLAQRIEQNKSNEAQQARYEALTNRVVTVIESNVKVIITFTEKFENFANAEKLRAEIAETREQLINELRENLNVKGAGSRRQ